MQIQINFDSPVLRKPDGKEDCKAFFRDQLTKDQRKIWLERYNRLIAIENDEVIEYHGLAHKKSGSRIIFTKFPWMLPAWLRGREYLKEVIAEMD